MSARTLKDAQAELKLARKAVAIAVNALEFYANPETYFALMIMSDPPSGEFTRDFGDTHLGRKPGKKARKAIDRLVALANAQKAVTRGK